MMIELMNKLLWSTIEDYVGLWELTWEVNSILKSNNSSNKALTKKILLNFLNAGLIKLYYNKWGDVPNKEISLQEAIEVLESEEFWLAPKLNDLCVKISSTKKGEKYYNEDLISDID